MREDASINALRADFYRPLGIGIAAAALVGVSLTLIFSKIYTEATH